MSYGCASDNPEETDYASVPMLPTTRTDAAALTTLLPTLRPLSRVEKVAIPVALIGGSGLLPIVFGAFASYVGVTALIMGVMAYRRWLTEMDPQLHEAARLLGAGDVRRATKLLEGLCVNSRWLTHDSRIMLIYYRGMAAMDAGDIELALAALTVAEESGLFVRGQWLEQYEPFLQVKLGVVYAFRDDRPIG